MIKAILAVDDNGGVSKNGSMPWPHNSKDLEWFKKNTDNNIVIMGRITWIDPKMPTPLPDRINVLITSQSPEIYPGADIYINSNLTESIKKIDSKYVNKICWIIGGPNIINQLFPIIEEFYLTRIYGNYHCDTFLDLSIIEKEMKLKSQVNTDNTCHFEIWNK